MMVFSVIRSFVDICEKNTGLNALLQTAIDQSFNAVVITDANFQDGGPHIIYCNSAFCAMTGYEASQLINQSPRILQGPLTSRAVISHLKACLGNNAFFQGSTVNYRQDGSAYIVEWNISPVRDADGKVQYFVSVQQDITARVRAEKRQALLATALNATHDAVLITDSDTRILFANQAFEKLTGYECDNGHIRQPDLNDENYQNFFAQLRKISQVDKSKRKVLSHFHRDKGLQYIDYTITRIPGEPGEAVHYVSVMKDVTAFVEREQQLQDQAHSDPLTKLLNRRGGTRQLRECLREAQSSGQPYAVILCDIDNFKQINDQFGHDVGDMVLRHCANVLSQNVRENDAVIRWGGDEFLLVLPGCGLNTAIDLGERIRTALTAHELPQAGAIRMSFGVSISQSAENPAVLMKRVDQALYTAKRNGRNQVAAVPAQT